MQPSTAKRLFVLSLCLSAATLGGALMAQIGANEASPVPVIKIEAKRFVYSPNEITLKKGQPVVLEFNSIDFVHGFKIPDLNLRADLPPGRVTRIPLTPDKVGVYDFLCDNFCGSGHEEMSGRIVVLD
jgi:cytochrome c oxidase subunit 2